MVTTCEECGSQDVRRIVAENGVTLQCKECGWERDYPIKKVFVKAPKLGFEPNKDELTPEQKEFLRPMGAEFTILERKKK